MLSFVGKALLLSDSSSSSSGGGGSNCMSLAALEFDQQARCTRCTAHSHERKAVIIDTRVCVTSFSNGMT